MAELAGDDLSFDTLYLHNHKVWAGLGLVSYEIGEDNRGDTDSSTEVGLNLLGGLEFPGVFRFGAPFAQVRYTTIDPAAGDLVTYDSQLSVFGGFRVAF